MTTFLLVAWVVVCAIVIAVTALVNPEVTL
jgi:hypothetical protein